MTSVITVIKDELTNKWVIKEDDKVIKEYESKEDAVKDFNKIMGFAS